jgi:hypothetical protein
MDPMPPEQGDPAARRLAARRRTYKALSLGITLICIGAVLLMNTLGRLGWGVWFDLLRLWPLLLISVGIRSIFLPTRLHALSLLGPLLVIAGAVLTVSWYRGRAAAGLEDLERGRAVGIDCPGPLRDVPARLHLVASAGRMSIVSSPSSGGGEEPVPAPGGGLTGTLHYAGDEPVWACSNEGDMWLGAEGGESSLRVILPFGPRRALWNAQLSCPGRVFVRGDLVAASTLLDLRAFDLDRVDLDLAASSTRLMLGAPRRPVDVRLEGAAANLDITLPAGTCYTLARERVFNVLKGTALPSGRRRERRLTADACKGQDSKSPRYEFRMELPFTTVRLDNDGA